jgi:hypothetical protein
MAVKLLIFFWAMILGRLAGRLSTIQKNTYLHLQAEEGVRTQKNTINIYREN